MLPKCIHYNVFFSLPAINLSLYVFFIWYCYFLLSLSPVTFGYLVNTFIAVTFSFNFLLAFFLYVCYLSVPLPPTLHFRFLLLASLFLLHT